MEEQSGLLLQKKCGSNGIHEARKDRNDRSNCFHETRIDGSITDHEVKNDGSNSDHEARNDGHEVRNGTYEL